MSAFTDRVDVLMSNRNITRYRFCLECEISESSYRAWIRGSIPNAEILYKIAVYFGVSMEYLISGNNPNFAALELALDSTEKEIINIYRSLDVKSKETAVRLIKAL